MSSEIALLGQILTLADDENVRIDAFGRVVASSPQLSAQVVKVANSALYGMEGKITRLERAVLILGVRTVATIASSVLVASQARRIQIGPLAGEALWRHSLETGACAELLCRCLGWPHESEAYLAGLLHDLGTQELFLEFGAPYAEIVTLACARGESQVEQERAFCGEDHGQRLAAVARRWGFPDVLCGAFAAHHESSTASNPAQAVAALVHAAHIVVDRPGGGWIDHPRNEEADARVLAALGLDEDDVADVRFTLVERLKELEAAFS